MRCFSSFATVMLLGSTALISSALLPQTAEAKTVYMVQLGSFESADQAKKQWNTLQKQFPQLLSALAYTPKSVTMPPQNVTYFRAQGGTVATRTQAQDICDEILSSGNECYVVETASGNAPPAPATKPDVPVVKQQAKSAPVKPAPVEIQEPTEAKAVAVATPSQEQKPEKKQVAKKAPTPPPTVSASSQATNLPKGYAPSIPESKPIPTTISKKALQDVDAWAKSNIPESEPQPAPTTANEEIDQMFADAAPTQDVALTPSAPEMQQTQPTQNNTQPQKKSSSWLDRMFSSDDDLSQPLQTNITPPEPIKQQALSAPPVIASTIAPEKPKVATPISQPTPTAVVTENVPSRKDTSTSAPVTTSVAAIPPMTFTHFTPDDSLPWRKQAVATSQITSSGVTLFGSSAPLKGATSEHANVEIAEAIRVPLSTMSQPTIRPIERKVDTAAAYGLPSEQLKSATLWAEIGSFTQQQAALSYWQTLRLRDNTLPAGLRVRVTQPFQRSYDHKTMSLRVGPFVTLDAVRRLCGHTQGDNLHCNVVKDLGDSVAMTNEPRKRYDASQRRNERAYPTTDGWHPFGANAAQKQRSVWLQLGVFPNPMLAQESWNRIKGAHGTVLSGVSEQIVSPEYSSARGARFRLRAGPFGSDLQAITVCEELRRSGTSCIVAP